VQEKKPLALRLARPRVHLDRPAARRSDQPIAKRARRFDGPVRAAAVEHGHLVAARAQRRERLERAADPGRLVQRRDDDGESFSDQS
jgi:hypothetical protein